MVSSTATKVTRRLRKLTGFRRRVRRGLAKPLADISDGALSQGLAAAGLRRADLFAELENNPAHRRRMGRLLAHFGVDRRPACEHYWRRLVQADAVCERCPNVGKCRRWIAWGRNNGAPEVFCPNAGLFKRLRLDLDLLMRLRPRTYPLEAGAGAQAAAEVAEAWHGSDRPGGAAGLRPGWPSGTD